MPGYFFSPLKLSALGHNQLKELDFEIHTTRLNVHCLFCMPDFTPLQEQC